MLGPTHMSADRLPRAPGQGLKLPEAKGRLKHAQAAGGRHGQASLSFQLCDEAVGQGQARDGHG